MGAGKRFELSLKNNICANTTDNVDALRPDFSGSSNHTVADVVVLYENDWGLTAAYIELKKRQAKKGNRATVMAGSSKGDSGMDELRALVDGTPPWASPAVGVKFNRKQLIVLEAENLLYAMGNDLQFDQHGLEARTTKAGNISMRKSGRIASQQAGQQPWKACCQYIGVRDGDICE